MSYKERGIQNKVIEIPSFVTDIYISNKLGLFQNVDHGLKVIYRHNDIKFTDCIAGARSMDLMFAGFGGDYLDLSEFDTSGAVSMHGCLVIVKVLRVLIYLILIQVR